MAPEASKSGRVVGAAVGGTFGAIILIAILFLFIWRRARRSSQALPEVESAAFGYAKRDSTQAAPLSFEKTASAVVENLRSDSHSQKRGPALQITTRPERNAILSLPTPIDIEHPPPTYQPDDDQRLSSIEIGSDRTDLPYLTTIAAV